MNMDMNKMLQQVQELQAQMAKAQEELASETVEASAGGGMVTVKATGALQITEIKISPEAIDPDDPELLADMVLAAVNEALRSAQSLAAVQAGWDVRARRPRRPRATGDVAATWPRRSCAATRGASPHARHGARLRERPERSPSSPPGRRAS